MRDVALEERDCLASQVTHNPATADKFYLLKQKQVNTFKTVDLIAKVMTKVHGEYVEKHFESLPINISEATDSIQTSEFVLTDVIH